MTVCNGTPVGTKKGGRKMDRAKRTFILSLIYLAITLSLLIRAFIAMENDQAEISFISLLAMVVMAVITDKVNDRCRNRNKQKEGDGG